MTTLADLRREYTLAGLRRADLEADPIVQFQKWFDQALKAELLEPNAMTLATVNEDHEPSARTVLLKQVDPRGFIFFTNYESRKGRELHAIPNAALNFFWGGLERQVCVRGHCSKVPRAESEAYFAMRPLGSQLGAWVSKQSSVVPDRLFLEKRLNEVTAQFAGKQTPTPDYWGGYVLAPTAIEFWQGRPNRLHDRFLYRLQGGKWIVERLSP
jgi:pyridoxamine 5'-phosphate oxidase